MVLEARIKRWLLWTITIILAIVVTEFFLSGEMPREPLDRLWEEHMLAGTSGIYADGKRTSYAAKRSFESAKGRPSDAWLTKEGIAVSDHRETSFFGLLRRGGWSLDEGLLAKAEARDSTIELYGKEAVREKPKPFFFIHWGIPGGYGYEFFLLHRKKGVEKAMIIKKWSFDRYGIARMLLMDWISDVRGFLRYDGEANNAIVTFTGVKRPFEERVDLSRVLEGKT